MHQKKVDTFSESRCRLLVSPPGVRRAYGGTPDIPEPDRQTDTSRPITADIPETLSVSQNYTKRRKKKKQEKGRKLKNATAEQRAERLAAVCVSSHTNTQLCFCAASRAFTSHFCLVPPLSVSVATTLISPPCLPACLPACLPLCSFSPLLSSPLFSSLFVFLFFFFKIPTPSQGKPSLPACLSTDFPEPSSSTLSFCKKKKKRSKTKRDGGTKNSNVL